jgi:uncharacterized protein YkwD
MARISIFDSGMWQTPHTRHAQRVTRRGTTLGLVACAAAVLLIGVVIGRMSMRPAADGDVYLRNSEPSPTATKLAALPVRDRPALERVARDEHALGTSTNPPVRPPARKPTGLIDGSGGGTPPYSTFGPQAETVGGDLSSLENDVVRLVNAERRKRGCVALRIDSRLVTSARAHSREMAASNYFNHASPTGESPWDRMEAAGYSNGGAENIARGYQTAAEAVREWMASSGHRRNILDCRLLATGVGVSLGGNGPWWTQDFGYS